VAQSTGHRAQGKTPAFVFYSFLNYKFQKNYLNDHKKFPEKSGKKGEKSEKNDQNGTSRSKTRILAAYFKHGAWGMEHGAWGEEQRAKVTGCRTPHAASRNNCEAVKYL